MRVSTAILHEFRKLGWPACVRSLGIAFEGSNFYSVPVRAGVRVEVRVHPLHVEIWHAGRLIARHERCHGRRQHVLDLEHYLDVLSHKPGAFAGSKPLAQWREAGGSVSYRLIPRAPNNQNAEVSHNAIRMANSTPPAMGSAQPG
jgi:hypothetical protein